MTEEKETLWGRLKSGKLPSMDVNTIVEFDQQNLLMAGTVIFVVVILITVAFFTIKKRLA